MGGRSSAAMRSGPGSGSRKKGSGSGSAGKKKKGRSSKTGKAGSGGKNNKGLGEGDIEGGKTFVPGVIGAIANGAQAGTQYTQNSNYTSWMGQNSQQNGCMANHKQIRKVTKVGRPRGLPKFIKKSIKRYIWASVRPLVVPPDPRIT